MTCHAICNLYTSVFAITGDSRSNTGWLLQTAQRHPCTIYWNIGAPCSHRSNCTANPLLCVSYELVSRRRFEARSVLCWRSGCWSISRHRVRGGMCHDMPGQSETDGHRIFAIIHYMCHTNISLRRYVLAGQFKIQTDMFICTWRIMLFASHTRTVDGCRRFSLSH